MIVATREELLALRGQLVDARTSLLTGQAVKEVWRDGRRIVYQGASASDINTAIAQVDSDIATLDSSVGASRPRYHALSVSFRG